MTDSTHTPNPPSTSGPPDYEGTDPELPDRKQQGSRSGISTVQVGASAAAAVTSALAASFFGVAGTLIGAAVGSIVSTIASALYADYLGRAGERIKVTRAVVIQRLPSEVVATTPLRRLTGPSDLPGRESLQPIGDENGDQTVAVPVEEAADLLRRPEGMAPLGQASTPAGPTRPVWKKPLLAMSAVSAAGFLIALGVLLTTESVIGHPVSGGTGGTTISELGRSDTSTSEVTPTESVTPTATPTSDDATTTTAPAAPTPTTEPTATGGTTAPVQPTAEATDPEAAATEPGAEGAAEATDAP